MAGLEGLQDHRRYKGGFMRFIGVCLKEVNRFYRRK